MSAAADSVDSTGIDFVRVEEEITRLDRSVQTLAQAALERIRMIHERASLSPSLEDVDEVLQICGADPDYKHCLSPIRNVYEVIHEQRQCAPPPAATGAG